MGSIMQKLTKLETEFFLWICCKTDLSIWYILNYYNEIYPLKTVFMLFSLFDKGYLVGHDYRIKVVPNESFVSLTDDGKALFESLCPTEFKGKTIVWKEQEKKKQEEYNIVVDDNELEQFFKTNGYETSWENEYTLVIRQGFSRYYIYKTPVSVFIEPCYLEQIIRKTHSILLVVPNEKIKQVAIVGINRWIHKCFKQIIDFLEDGNAYSVITIDELKRTPLFPKNIPENTHQHY